MKQILALIDEARGHIGDLDDTLPARRADDALNRAAARAQEIARTEAAALGEMPSTEAGDW